MKTDDNWKETRLLAKDLEDLIGLPVDVTEDLLKIIENLIVHKFLEKALESEGDDFTVSISLPYIGNLIVDINGKDNLSTSFVARKSFYNKIKNAYLNKESPLTLQCSEILGEDLAKRFEEGDDT